MADDLPSRIVVAIDDGVTRMECSDDAPGAHPLAEKAMRLDLARRVYRMYQAKMGVVEKETVPVEALTCDDCGTAFGRRHFRGCGHARIESTRPAQDAPVGSPLAVRLREGWTIPEDRG